MRGDRAQKQHATEYKEGLYDIVQMGNDRWYIFDDNIDLGRTFETLREARKWCKKNPADPDYAGKHS